MSVRWRLTCAWLSLLLLNFLTGSCTWVILFLVPFGRPGPCFCKFVLSSQYWDWGSYNLRLSIVGWWEPLSLWQTPQSNDQMICLVCLLVVCFVCFVSNTSWLSVEQEYNCYRCSVCRWTHLTDQTHLMGVSIAEARFSLFSLTYGLFFLSW